MRFVVVFFARLFSWTVAQVGLVSYGGSLRDEGQEDKGPLGLADVGTVVDLLCGDGESGLRTTEVMRGGSERA